ncbi:MAG: LuxR C-terminal-related transcriptional regulator, partial [Myxococcales bacterium]|nr:LuxR C-terminal-related transcriptional regulator [Myxococcales bacterium]
IARELFISIKTVDTHRTRIMKKLDVHSVGDLIRLAARHGFLAA